MATIAKALATRILAMMEKSACWCSPRRVTWAEFVSARLPASRRRRWVVLTDEQAPRQFSRLHGAMPPARVYVVTSEAVVDCREHDCGGGGGGGGA